MTILTMNIGDWSQDGHNINEEVDFIITSGHTKQQLIQGYKDSCEKTNMTFENNKPGRKICVDYMENIVSDDIAEELIFKWGVPEAYINYDDADGFTGLILHFIKISIPDFSWEMTSTNKEYFNGNWGDLSGFGYGLFE